MTPLLVPGTPGMTSRQIAELTGKQHKNVTRDCRTMLEALELDALKYEHTYKDDSNRDQTEYVLTEELTLTLTSGYSIKQRHAIVTFFTTHRNPPPPKDPLTQLGELVYNLQQENLKRLEAVETRLDNLNGDTGYMTALAYCRQHGMSAPLKVANLLGRKASKYCREADITMGEVPDERWGSVKSYPVEVLREMSA